MSRTFSTLTLLALVLLGSCGSAVQTQDQKASVNITVPPDDARDLARVYSLIDENKLVIAEMRLKELREGVSSDVTRTLIDMALAEVSFRRKENSSAASIAGRYSNCPYDEVSSDAHFLLGRIELQAWHLDVAHREFETARKIARQGGLNLREERAKEYLRFTDALVMFNSGNYAEAKEAFRSLRDPELRKVSTALFGN
jgi:hypothetical protein